MDKYEYRVKTEQMLEHLEKKQYKKAMDIADTIDWRRVKSVSMLNSVSEIYENNGEYQKSWDVLFVAHDRSPESRKIIYRLGILALKINDTEEATECYEEFVKLAPKDPNQYILKYKILKARRAPIAEQIETLEAFKKAEYVEKWAYELASLYHAAGMTSECLEECDDLILWFSEGKYVYQAMELKMKYKPLTPLQQEKYNNRHAYLAAEAAEEAAALAAEEEPDSEEAADTADITGDVTETAYADAEDEVETETPAASVTEEVSPATQEINLADLLGDDKSDEEDELDMDKTRKMPEPEELQKKENAGIRTTVKGATLAEALVNGVALANGLDIEEKASNKKDEELRITGQMKIDEILQEWESKQKVNAEAIEDQKKKDEEILLEKRREEERRREEEARRIEEQQRAAEEARRIEEQKAAEEARRLAKQKEEEERILAQQKAEEEERLKKEKAAEEERLLERLAAGKAAEDIAEDAPIEETEEPAAEDVEEAVESQEAEESDDAEVMEESQEDVIVSDSDADLEDLTETESSEEDDYEEESYDSEDAEDEAEEANQSTDGLTGMTADLRQLMKDLEEETGSQPEAVAAEAMGLDEDDYEEDDFIETDSDEEDDEFFDDDEADDYDEDDFEEYEEKSKSVDKIEDVEDEDEDDFFDDDFDEFEEDEEEPEEEEEEPEEELEIEEPTEEEIQRRIKKGKSGVPFDTGFVVTGRYDLSATSEIGLKAGLTEEQKKLFSYFVPVRGMSEQIVEVLDNDRREQREGTSRAGNILVIGHKGSGKTVLAVDIVKAIQKQRNLKQGKVAIVTGESLNKKELSNIIQKLRGGAIIIEKAGRLNTRTVKELNHLMEKKTGELLFVLEDQRKALERLFTANPDFKKKFTSRLELPVFVNDELVTFGQTYAKENGYKLDEMGILALYSRIDVMQREDHSVTVAEVKEIMDEAIDHSQKANVKHLARRMFGKGTDDSDRIILKEEDFRN